MSYTFRGRVLNLGSINIDHSYTVPHFVRPGETIGSLTYARGAGGKGYNQSIGLARAGASVAHLGAIGEDGRWLREELATEGVDVSGIRLMRESTGHAIVQVNPAGENSILLHAGANQAITLEDLTATLAKFWPGDRFLCQNETALVPEAIRRAKERGMEIWFNPAPMTPAVNDYPLSLLDWLIVNESEGSALSGKDTAENIVESLRERLPKTHLVLTRGAAGVVYAHESTFHVVPAAEVQTVDTTSAGDTFIGFLLAGIMDGMTVSAALSRSCAAAAVSVSRRGAATSIPTLAEVEEYLSSRMHALKTTFGAIPLDAGVPESCDKKIVGH